MQKIKRLALAFTLFVGGDGPTLAADDTDIAALLHGMFDKPEAALRVAPIVVTGDHAIADWAQGDVGGRALLRRTSQQWSLVLCTGDAIHAAGTLEKAGVPSAQAAQLKRDLSSAEARLSPETLPRSHDLKAGHDGCRPSDRSCRPRASTLEIALRKLDAPCSRPLKSPPRSSMKSRNPIFIPLLVCALAVWPVTASAHVVLEKREAAIGTYYKAVFQVGHGCEGSPTVKLRIQIPDGVIAVKPMPKSGWTIETVKGAYAAKAAHHGHEISEGVREVIWSGKLPDDYFDEFVLSGFLAATLVPGATLYFPATQECEQGVNRWVEIPDASKQAPKSPAPGLRLIAKP